MLKIPACYYVGIINGGGGNMQGIRLVFGSNNFLLKIFICEFDAACIKGYKDWIGLYYTVRQCFYPNRSRFQFCKGQIGYDSSIIAI